MTCGDVQRHIDAYVDNELTGAVRLKVAAHIAVCRDCADEEAGLRELGDMLRGSASLRPIPTGELEGLAGGVVSRIGAEAQQSLAAKWSRVYDEWQWIAIGGGACTATFVAAVFVFAALYSPTTQARQMNEKVGTLCLMAVPEDGAGEPVMLEYERELGTGKSSRACSVPASFGWKAEQALISALDTSLMRDGRLVSFSSLSPVEREEVEQLLEEIGRMRRSVPSRRPSGLTNVSGLHLQLSEVVTASGL